jgi:site-specific recombinase XerD
MANSGAVSAAYCWGVQVALVFLYEAMLGQHEKTFHTLRHSFVARLMEDGVDMRYIQELFRHSSIETTEWYTHVTERGKQKI